MRCDTCDYLLDASDNYCRKCGAAVQLASVPAVRSAQSPALFRSTAAPLATGAAAVAATAVLRWAVGHVLRGVLDGGRARRVEPAPRRVPVRRAAAPPSSGGRGMVEIIWYRRTPAD